MLVRKAAAADSGGQGAGQLVQLGLHGIRRAAWVTVVPLSAAMLREASAFSAAGNSFYPKAGVARCNTWAAITLPADAQSIRACIGRSPGTFNGARISVTPL